MTDEELMARFCRHDDREALDLLFERYRGMLESFFSKTGRGEEGAKDLTQEVFNLIMTHKDKYEIGRAFNPWIFTIAIRLTQWNRRRRQRGREVVKLELLTKWADEFEVPRRWIGDYLKLLDTGHVSPRFAERLRVRENFRILLATIVDPLVIGRSRCQFVERSLGIQP